MADSRISGQMGRQCGSGAGFVQKLVPALIVIGAAVVVGVVAMMPKANRDKPATEAPPVNVQVEVVKAEAEFPDSFDLPAVVEPNRIVKVSAEVAGRVEHIEFVEGAPCRAGDVLVRLNTDLLKADYDRAAAQAEFDAKRYERLVRLSESQVASQQDRDQAEAQMAVSKAALEFEQAKLDRTTVLAPIDGVVNDVTVEEGEYVQPGQSVAEIVDIETVKVVVYVPERDVHFFATGAAGLVLSDSNGQPRQLSGTISYISQVAEEKTRTTRMEITVGNRDRVLRSGQIVRVRLTRQVLKDVVLIPLLAVIPLETGHQVYVEQGGKAEPRDVALGFLKDQRVQVVSGLQAGDRLIVAGHRFVGPGQAVRVISEQ